MYIKGITADALICHKCECGELNVHGFWHQVHKDICKQRKRAVVFMSCKVCGRVRRKQYILTTGRWNHRLIKWLDFAWLAYRWLPFRLAKWFAGWMMWLEKRMPL